MVWPIAAYAGIVVLLVAFMLVSSWLLGERHEARSTGVPYEAGIPPTGSARVRFPAQYYLFAMFFAVFDLEAVFVFGWAIAGRELGWAGYATMLVFVAVLVAALAYLWGVGALEFRGKPVRARGERKP